MKKAIQGLIFVLLFSMNSVQAEGAWPHNLASLSFAQQQLIMDAQAAKGIYGPEFRFYTLFLELPAADPNFRTVIYASSERRLQCTVISRIHLDVQGSQIENVRFSFQDCER